MAQFLTWFRSFYLNMQYMRFLMTFLSWWLEHRALLKVFSQMEQFQMIHNFGRPLEWNLYHGASYPSSLTNRRKCHTTTKQHGGHARQRGSRAGWLPVKPTSSQPPPPLTRSSISLFSHCWAYRKRKQVLKKKKNAFVHRTNPPVLPGNLNHFSLSSDIASSQSHSNLTCSNKDMQFQK